MMPHPGSDQSVETTTLRRHTWKLMNVLLRSSPKKSLPLKPLRWRTQHIFFLSLTCIFPHRLFPQGVHLCFPSPKLWGPFFCPCNLFPEPTQPSWLTSSTAHFFYLWLSKLKNLFILKFYFVYIWVLALSSFLAKYQGLRYNIWCHSTTNTLNLRQMLRFWWCLLNDFWDPRWHTSHFWPDSMKPL